MRTPRSAKYYKKKGKDRRGRHTKVDRLAKLRSLRDARRNPTCRSCSEDLDVNIKTEEGDALVCTNCGLVDNNTCFDFEPPLGINIISSPFYMHRNYFAEKILQARNREPRLTDREKDIMSIVYDIYKRNCPLLWSEANFTKKHCGQICRLITRIYPKTPFCRRIERWYQYRVYICGDTNNELSYKVADKLRTLFDAYAHFFLLDIQENNKPKSNITQLDLVILVLLYNIKMKYVNKHGWYFLNHNIVNNTPSIIRDRDRILEICTMINDRILRPDAKYSNIRSQCYRWFRKGNKLKVPHVSMLLSMCMYSKFGVIQYVNYKTKNDASLLYYLENHLPESYT